MNKTLKTILLFIILVIAAIVVAAAIKFNASQDDMYAHHSDEVVEKTDVTDEYIFTTNTGDTGVLMYSGEDKENATLSIQGTTYQLKRSPSASGAKYTNEDESVVYWEHQGEATIEVEASSYTTEHIQSADILTFHIAPYTQECVGVGPMTCLVVNGELFYDSIEDFEFEEGTEYEITVARTERENVPADASIYQYRRVEVLKSNKQGDPDANKYDLNESCNDMDQDCTGPDALDDDSDGDSILVEVEDETVIINNENPLADSTWEWKETIMNNDSTITPEDSSRFIAEFSDDGHFSSTTDCNNTFGSYTVSDARELQFGHLASTLMYCEGSLEGAYGSALAEVTSYMIAENGNLVLMLKYDSGSMIFSPIDNSDTEKATDYNSSRSNKSY